MSLSVKEISVSESAPDKHHILLLCSLPLRRYRASPAFPCLLPDADTIHIPYPDSRYQAPCILPKKASPPEIWRQHQERPEIICLLDILCSRTEFHPPLHRPVRSDQIISYAVMGSFPLHNDDILIIPNLPDVFRPFPALALVFQRIVKSGNRCIIVFLGRIAVFFISFPAKKQMVLPKLPAFLTINR